MFQCGDRVVYGIHGVCQIVTTETRRVDKRDITYFVLEPLDQPGARFYIPTNNEAALSKLRPIVTKEELDKLLHEAMITVDCWIQDENQRKQRYRELITGGSRVELLQMVSTLYNRKQEMLFCGKKLHLCDENFLKDAQKLLDSEFLSVLGIEHEDVPAYVQGVLNR